MPLPRGTQVRRYRIESLLGEGGMGEVYRARDTELDRVIALKVLREGDERRFVQEGRAAIALNHPNIAHLYDLGQENGIRFMAMEYVEGETLRARLWRGPMTEKEAIEIATQIASALKAAHEAGIVHRDIKPENVMIRADGYVKVLDFGLAKLTAPAEISTLTAEGFTVGTIDYMSPEQLKGQPVDPRTDIYSLGVVLREMAPASKRLASVIARATARNREERYSSAQELIDALKAPAERPRRIWPWVAAAAIVAVVVAGFPFVRRSDEPVALIAPPATESVSVVSEPAGANVYLERVRRDGDTEPRVLAGTTPLKKYAVARGAYIVTVEKEGFAPFTRTISLTTIHLSGMVLPPSPVDLKCTLLPRGMVPEEMSVVEGEARYRLAAWSRPTQSPADLDPFLIDRFEVSNRDFAQFVGAGGYQRRELWKHPFIKDGRTLAFDEAMKLFVDTTGLPGPRNWSGQTFAPGRENDPVTHVTWYEAAAYAESRGKSLPTIYQWDKAARDGRATPLGPVFPWGIVSPGVDVLRRANFRGRGPMPVQSLRSGMSPFGVQQMAGNVAEWCLNVLDDGFAVTGGAYDSAAYEFGLYGSRPGFYNSATVGFRCARLLGASAGNQGAAPISREANRRKPEPASDVEFRKIEQAYAYEDTPLDARIIERRVDEGWIVETIELNGSHGERTRAYLFLPKNRRPPFQVIHYVPPGDVAGGLRTLEESTAVTLGPHVRSGRAAFGVLLRGYIGRPSTETRHAPESAEYADAIADHVIDLRRGLDYLQTRADVDASKIGLLGPSGGGALGLILAGVDHRYRSTMFNGVGIGKVDEHVHPSARRTNFAPHITGPKLVMQGRFDDVIPLWSDVQPFFDILAEPKRLTLYDGPHVPPTDLLIRAVKSWFDETLGPV